jgi:hypothetical protein
MFSSLNDELFRQYILIDPAVNEGIRHFLKDEGGRRKDEQRPARSATVRSLTPLLSRTAAVSDVAASGGGF